jgi:hypothetical protein
VYSENGFTAQGNPDLKAKAPFVLLLWSTHDWRLFCFQAWPYLQRHNRHAS